MVHRRDAEAQSMEINQTQEKDFLGAAY